jgi:hypothetical protein
MTLELERDMLYSGDTDIDSSSSSSSSSSWNLHEPLVLVGTGTPTEYVVAVDGSPGALAVAVIREELSGTYCYPHGPAHPRLGPFGSVGEALEACRDVQRSERCYDSCCGGL